VSLGDATTADGLDGVVVVPGVIAVVGVVGVVVGVNVRLLASETCAFRSRGGGEVARRACVEGAGATVPSTPSFLGRGCEHVGT
jgi:hypothetical protein